MPNTTAKNTTSQEQCVVCSATEHEGDGWIYPISDAEIVEITSDGPKRELKNDARPICSIDCKEEFESSDKYTQ